MLVVELFGRVDDLGVPQARMLTVGEVQTPLEDVLWRRAPNFVASDVIAEMEMGAAGSRSQLTSEIEVELERHLVGVMVFDLLLELGRRTEVVGLPVPNLRDDPEASPFCFGAELSQSFESLLTRLVGRRRSVGV